MANNTTSILVFGDSIVAGYGLTKEESLSAHLETLLRQKGHDVTIVNGGVSGDTTGSGRNRLEWTLQQYRPHIVIVALGGNDILRGIPARITRENMDAMLDTLKKYKIRTILSSVLAPVNLGAEYRKELNDIYPTLAKKYNVSLYPFFLEGLYGNNTLMQSDGIHPNAAGAKRIAEELATYLESYLR